MTKHTPGPWDYNNAPEGAFEIMSLGVNVVLRIRGGMKPTAHDARLITAAPELLAVAKSALVELVACLEELGEPDSEIPARLREVIAKATGEQPVRETGWRESKHAAPKRCGAGTFDGSRSCDLPAGHAGVHRDNWRTWPNEPEAHPAERHNHASTWPCDMTCPVHQSWRSRS